MSIAKEKSKQLYEKLQEIFMRVRPRFYWTSDEVVWNKSEHWENEDQIPDEGIIYGDCDCFALACRKECRKEGIDSRLVFCAVWYGGEWVGHLVLEVNGWIFDNNQWEVKRSQDIDYLWMYISGYEKGDPWREISDYDPDVYNSAMKQNDKSKS